MKVKEKVYKIVNDIRNSFKRFPITVGISFILVATLMYLIEEENSISSILRNKLMRGSMILGMGVLLSLIIGLFHERFNIDKTRKWIDYGLGAIFLVLYYTFLLKGFKALEIKRYLGFMLTFFIMVFYVGKIKMNGEYEKYVVNIFSSIGITMIYSFVLLFGIFAILFTIYQLFDINIDGKWYMYTFLIVVLIFGVSYFISKIPYVDDSFKGYGYSKAFIILLSFIVIPLITVYTAILYAYFLKILMTWEWPKVLVSHLVLWYSSFSVGILFLISPVIEENKFLKFFKNWFPKLILPILIMMFISISQRIGQYGFTEDRYFIVVLGLWVFAIMVYFSIKKPLKNIIIPISLSIVVLNSVIGPGSSFAISKHSQNSRFLGILERNNMVEGGQIVKNPDISKEDKREINNIIYYFENNHDLEDIKTLKKDYATNKTEEIFGFKYEPDLYFQGIMENYFYLNTDFQNKIIPIGDFDYEIRITSWEGRIIDLDIKDGFKLNYEANDKTLNINENDNILLNLDLNEITTNIYKKSLDIDSKENISKDSLDIEDMTYEAENEDIKVKLIFNHISGKINGEDRLVEIEKGVDFTIFLDFK